MSPHSHSPCTLDQTFEKGCDFIPDLRSTNLGGSPAGNLPGSLGIQPPEYSCHSPSSCFWILLELLLGPQELRCWKCPNLALPVVRESSCCLCCNLPNRRDSCDANATLCQASVCHAPIIRVGWTAVPFLDGPGEASEPPGVSLSQNLIFPNLPPFPKGAADSSARLGTKHDENIKDLPNWVAQVEPV